MNIPETAGKNMYVNNRRRRKKNVIAMKTSAFCNRLKKVTCDKIGNTYHKIKKAVPEDKWLWRGNVLGNSVLSDIPIPPG